MTQLRHQQKRLDELKINVKVVAFDDDLMASAYAKQYDLQWPILIDHDRELYAAYEMGKGSWWSICNPIAIFRYISLILRGAKLGKPGSDVFQMGGDVLIDPTGIVRMHHPSSNPHDRPTPRTIFELVERQS